MQTKEINKNRFIDGKWVYHPIIIADIIYVDCPRTVCLLLDDMDYSFIKDKKELFSTIHDQLGRLYPDFELDSYQVFDYDFISVKENYKLSRVGRKEATMTEKTTSHDKLESAPCSLFAVFGEGRNRVAIHRDRITMVHDEETETLIKLDMGSGNFESTHRLKMPFVEVMGILDNLKGT